MLEELRHDAGLPDPDLRPLMRGERELAMALHAQALAPGDAIYQPIPAFMGCGPRLGAASYVFIRVKRMRDSVAFTQTLLRRAGFGLAPGAAVGDRDHLLDVYLRLCFTATMPGLERPSGRLAGQMAAMRAGRRM